uniref:Uncharacterized protein n=1 Tax=Anguilla anguilla TaxID=7936 RepID=A0A0E9VXC4_ANGAN
MRGLVDDYYMALSTILVSSY